jgi:hypothetical protein
VAWVDSWVVEATRRAISDQTDRSIGTVGPQTAQGLAEPGQALHR